MATALSAPGPKGHPLVGSLPEFGRDVLGFLTDCARRHGDVVAFRLAGWPVYLVSDPDAIEDVLVRNQRNFVKHSFFWRHVRGLFGEGLLTSEGEAWLRRRRLAAPAFHGERLAGYAQQMVLSTERMLDRWDGGELRDAHAEMAALTGEIAAKTLFGAELADEIAEIGRAFDVVAHEIAARFRRPVLIPDRIPIPGNVRYLRGVRRLDGIVHAMIEGRRRSGEDRGDLLSALLASRDEDGRLLTDRQLRDEVVTLFLAGHETTALALAWTWYLLSQHPAAEDKLVAELEGALGDRTPTVADLARLPYTKQVLTEAMRLYPPAWTIGREAVADCRIGGYPIPAGATIVISQWVMHRHPRHFDRPDAFLPERWSGDLEKRLPRYVYMPFGGGPRVCIGNRFAMMEAMLVVATVARRFRLVWRPEFPVVPFPSITLRPKGGVWVTVSRR